MCRGKDAKTIFICDIVGCTAVGGLALQPRCKKVVGPIGFSPRPSLTARIHERIDELVNLNGTKVKGESFFSRCSHCDLLGIIQGVPHL